MRANKINNKIFNHKTSYLKIFEHRYTVPTDINAAKRKTITKPKFFPR
jgi:hypothetical protein